MTRTCVVCGKWFTQAKLFPMEEFRPQVCEQSACLLEFIKEAASTAPDASTLHISDPAVTEFTEHSNVVSLRSMLSQMRSEYERHFARWLERSGLRWRCEWSYETLSFYLPHKTYRTYIPDFLIFGKVFIEVKGMWTFAGKGKVKLFRKAFPHHPIFVIDAPVITRLRKEIS